MNNSKPIDTFLQIFGLWFNSDIINLGSEQSVNSRLENCVTQTVEDVPELPEIVAYLREVLADWTPQNIYPFDHHSNVPWTRGELRPMLKRCLTFIIDQLELEIAARERRNSAL